MDPSVNLDSVSDFEMTLVSILVLALPWTLMIAAGAWIVAKLIGWRKKGARRV